MKIGEIIEVGRRDPAPLWEPEPQVIEPDVEPSTVEPIVVEPEFV